MKKYLCAAVFCLATTAVFATNYGTFNFTISSDKNSAIPISFDYVVCGEPASNKKVNNHSSIDYCSLQPDGGQTGLNEIHFSHQVLYPGQTLNLTLPKAGPKVNYVKTYNEKEGTGYSGPSFIFAPFCYAYAGGSLSMRFIKSKTGIISHICNGFPHVPE